VVFFIFARGFIQRLAGPVTVTTKGSKPLGPKTAEQAGGISADGVYGLMHILSLFDLSHKNNSRCQLWSALTLFDLI
jgi:hypothetical protein